jgi:hypothetical protein
MGPIFKDPMKVGPWDHRLSQNVRNYQSALRNIPEEPISITMVTALHTFCRNWLPTVLLSQELFT